MGTSLRNLLVTVLKQGLLQTRTQTIDSRIARTFPSSPVVSISAASCTSSVNQSTYRLPGCRHFHTSSRKNDKFDPEEIKNPFFSKIPENWLKYNEIVYPPQKPGEPKRPAEIVHMKNHIKYSTDKMWYMAMMIRGMTVDEAIKQLSLAKHKGAHIIKEVILEAQEMAVKEHNVEFKSNLWVEETNVARGKVIKSQRKHARRRPGVIHYRHTHFFIRLREGKPPKHYYPPPETGYEKMENYIKTQRNRRIILSL